MVANSGVHRGEVWWAGLREAVASESGYRRPVIVVGGDDFNRSRVKTVLAAVLTTNLRLVGERAMLTVEDGLRTVLAL